MSAESEELKALSFVRRSLLRKNEKIRELTRTVASLKEEVDNLKWKCNDQRKEIDALRSDALRSDAEAYQHVEGIGSGSFTEGTEGETEYFEANAESSQANEETGDIFVKEEQNTNDDVDGGSNSYDNMEHTGTVGFSDVDNKTIADASEAAGFAQEILNQQDNDQLDPQIPIHLQLSANQGPSRTHSSRVTTMQAAGSGGAPQDHHRHQTGGRVAVCDTCGKTFTAESLLRRHRRVHTGEKPFTCPVCQRTFTQQVHLKRHVIVLHPDYTLATCPGCNKTFVFGEHLDRHLELFCMSRLHGKQLHN